jgi:hypothetical protein
LTHAIVVPECSDDVVHTCTVPGIEKTMGTVNDERQRRPDVQDGPRRCFGCTKESQIEAMWLFKNDTSPASTHVCQRYPLRYSLFFRWLEIFIYIFIHIKIKCF